VYIHLGDGRCEPPGRRAGQGAGHRVVRRAYGGNAAEGGCRSWGRIACWRFCTMPHRWRCGAIRTIRFPFASTKGRRPALAPRRTAASTRRFYRAGHRRCSRPTKAVRQACSGSEATMAFVVQIGGTFGRPSNSTGSKPLLWRIWSPEPAGGRYGPGRCPVLSAMTPAKRTVPVCEARAPTSPIFRRAGDGHAALPPERVTIALLAMRCAHGFEARSYTGRQVGYHHDSTHTKARIVRIAAEWIPAGLDIGHHPGRGRGSRGSTSRTTSRRSTWRLGSHSVALAAALKAEHCFHYLYRCGRRGTRRTPTHVLRVPLQRRSDRLCTNSSHCRHRFRIRIGQSSAMLR